MKTESLEDNAMKMGTQDAIKEILSRLAGLNRAVISDEFEESLSYLSRYVDLKVHRYKTGADCWTWNVPPKWKINEGTIGRRIVLFQSTENVCR